MEKTSNKIFHSLFFLSVISLLGFLVVFFLLCSHIDMGYEEKTGDAGADYILGQFGPTGAAIIIIGFPLLFILLNFLYLSFLKM